MQIKGFKLRQLPRLEQLDRKTQIGQYCASIQLVSGESLDKAELPEVCSDVITKGGGDLENVQEGMKCRLGQIRLMQIRQQLGWYFRGDDARN